MSGGARRRVRSAALRSRPRELPGPRRCPREPLVLDATPCVRPFSPRAQRPRAAGRAPVRAPSEAARV